MVGRASRHSSRRHCSQVAACSPVAPGAIGRARRLDLRRSVHASPDSPQHAGPSGPRPGVPNADRAITGTDGGDIDALAANAIDRHRELLGQPSTRLCSTRPFEPVDELISWDPTESRRPGLLRRDHRRTHQRRVLQHRSTPSVGIANCCCPRYDEKFGECPSP